MADEPVAPVGIPSFKPHRLDAYQLDNYSDHVSFGLDRQRVATMLRETADRIEAAEYIIAEVSVLTNAKSGEYATTYLTLQFHQKKVEPDGKPIPQTGRRILIEHDLDSQTAL